MVLLGLEVLGQVRVAGFQQGVVQGEGSIGTIVDRLGQLNDGRGSVIWIGVRLERITEYVAYQSSLSFEFNGLGLEVKSQLFVFQRQCLEILGWKLVIDSSVLRGCCTAIRTIESHVVQFLSLFGRIRRMDCCRGCQFRHPLESNLCHS
jgi:hypothetical protein